MIGSVHVEISLNFIYKELIDKTQLKTLYLVQKLLHQTSCTV